MPPANLTAPKIVLFAVLAVAFAAFGAWLFPSKQAPRRKVPPQIAPAVPLSGGSLADERPPLSLGPLSDQAILDLLDAYTHPQDPDRPPHLQGTTDEGLAREPEENVAQVLKRGEELAGNGSDRARRLLNLGRLADAHREKELATAFYAKAALNSSAAKAFLGVSRESAMEGSQLLDDSIKGGFLPAIKMKEAFTAECISYLDKRLLHPGETDKPANKVGVSDFTLEKMPPEDLESLLENYGTWTKTQTNVPRLCFGIGRAAFFREDFAHAQEYLEAAAHMGSPGAMAYLPKLPAYADKFAQNVELLQIASSKGFAPAREWLESASRLVFDPKVFTGATHVIDALYNGQVNALLAGKIFFDDVDISGPTGGLFKQAMLLDYMAEFADYLDGDIPSFVGDPKKLFGLIQNGKGAKGKKKRDDSQSGLAANRKLGGAMFLFGKLMSGDGTGLIRGATDPEGFNASLKQQREQITKMAQAHARSLFILKDKGNNALDRIYPSVAEFIDRYEGKLF